MSSIFRKSVLGSAIALGLLASGQAAAELSANVGFSSEYIFRGVYQAESSASAGLDYSHDSGFYVGTWAADVNQGLEYDIYGGYEGSIADFSYGIGFTGYYYTDKFDETYQEINLSLGYGPITVTHQIGEYDSKPTKQDYTFSTIKGEYNGFYALYGTWGNDFKGSYIQVGYEADVSGFTVGGAIVKSDKDLAPMKAGETSDDGETRLVFSITKTFDL